MQQQEAAMGCARGVHGPAWNRALGRKAALAPRFAFANRAHLQEFDAHLRQLAGPLEECLDATLRATSHVLHAIQVAEACFSDPSAAQAQQHRHLQHGAEQHATTSDGRTPGRHGSARPGRVLTPQPDVILAALGFQKEMLCHVACDYLAQLRAGHQSCLAAMRSRNQESLAHRRSALAKRVSDLEAQRHAAIKRKASADADVAQLNQEMERVWVPLNAERLRIADHVQSCQVRLWLTRWGVVAQQGARGKRALTS